MSQDFCYDETEKKYIYILIDKAITKKSTEWNDKKRSKKGLKNPLDSL